LSVANDWGSPLGLSASLSALIVGRDEGIFYRSTGGEMIVARTDGWIDEIRLFVERQSDVPVRTHASLARVFDDDRRFPPNILAERITESGVTLRQFGHRGEDPDRLRSTSDLRIEAATGPRDYVRAMLTLTADQPIGPMRTVLTASGGTTGGTVPVQRLWFFGGMSSIRGQPILSHAGNSYWLGRAELSGRSTGAQLFVFGDIGWAGARESFGRDGAPISGAGVGVKVLDGLIRFTVAKGVRPTRGVRAGLTFGGAL
jgi:hypothetical protein